jgi:2-dehydro-3-deoxygluconokinase
MSDLVAFGESMLRLSPPQGERLEQSDSLSCHAGGPESNAAIAAERLGAVSTWLSKVADSPLGRRVVGELHHQGIETEVVWSDDHRQGLYFVENSAEPRGPTVVYDRDGSAMRSVSPDELDLSPLRGARVFYTSGATPALSSTACETTIELLKLARDEGLTTAMDFNYQEQLWSTSEANNQLTQLLPAIDILFISSSDAEEVLGLQSGQPAQFAHTLASEYDFRTVVVTKHDLGAVAWHDSVVHEHESYEVDTIDRIGASDAFAGAFLARRLSGDDVPDALKYATATAALKCTITGDAAILTKPEVDQFLTDNGEMDSTW